MLKSVSLNTDLFIKLALTIIIVFQLSGVLIGQEVWSSDRFLDIDRGVEVLPYQENLNFIDRAKGMPFVDRYDFRTETDEMELERQQFQLRFQFNSRDERKAFDQIMLANKDKYKWMQAQYELDIWEERYNNIVDLYFLQKEIDLVKQDLGFLYDKKTVLKKILDSDTKINIGDWITNENEIFNVLSDSLELELQKKEIAQKIFGAERSVPILNQEDFISVERIREIVSEVMMDTDKHPDEGLASAEEKVAQAEFNLEEAEGRRWLEFAQIQYQSDNDLGFQREISLGTSITIPSKSNNRTKKNEATLELLEKSYETRIEQEENEKELLTDQVKLLSLIEQLVSFEDRRKDQKLEEIFDSYSEKKIVSPLVLISIKRSILNNAKTQLDLEKDIYELYVNLLTKKAAFLKVPRKNFLKD